MKKKIFLFLAVAFLFVMLSVTVYAVDAEITTVTLSGATAPKAGDQPDFSISVGSSVHATIEQVEWWNPSSPLGSKEEFKSGTSYTMIVYLRPNSGYSFAEPTSMSIGLNGISGYSIAIESYGGNQKTGRALYFYFNALQSATGLKAPEISTKNTADSIQVTFQKVEGAAKYRVLRKAQGESSWKFMANVIGTTYTDKSVVSGKEYTYAVRSVASDGTTMSTLSNTSVITRMTEPVFTAANTSGGVKISVTKVSGASKYRLLRKAEGETSWKFISYFTGTAYTDTTVTSGKKYTYAVRSVASDGTTMSVIVKTKSVIYMAESQFTAANTSGGIKVTIAGVSGASKYRILRKAEGETDWKFISYVTGSSYTDKSVKTGTKYTYAVRSVASDGTTMSVISTTKDVIYLSEPEFTAANTAGGVKVTITKVSGASKYRILRKAEGETGWKFIAYASGTAYTDKSVTSGVKYTYAVRSVASDGTTMSVIVKTKSVIYMAEPAFTVAATGDGIKVSITKVSGASKYRILRKAAGETSWKFISYVTGTAYTDKSVTSGVKYTYAVRSVASDGTTMSVISSTKTVTR